LAVACAEKAAVSRRLNGHAQGTVIVIAKSDEAEGLKRAFATAHGIEHLGHPANRAGVGLKCDFHKVTLAKRLGKA
jgi:hypothetical protein